jgi:N6-L-threonylcarbamoyladenine synthase
MKVLAIETSCDETAAAVVEGTSVLSSVISSQIDLHAKFGGVVPEIASRAHIESLIPVIDEALQRAEIERPDAIAATCGPGLIGSLLVGLSAAKALSLAWGVPFVGVNHLEGHLFAPLIEQPDLVGPWIVLLVSGGHTMLLEVEAPGEYRLLGQTLDDAAGEAYDKVARYLGLGYPGGPVVDRVSKEGDPKKWPMPRAWLGDSYDFSFSGIKTAVVRTVEKNPDARTEDLAASFQEAVVDVLVTKCARAVAERNATALCLGGGVAANSLLRQRATEAVSVPTYLPAFSMCTDNAAMIGAAGHWRLTHDGNSALSLPADPNLGLLCTT